MGKLEFVKSFLTESFFYFSYTKMNFRHVFFGPPGRYISVPLETLTGSKCTCPTVLCLSF